MSNADSLLNTAFEAYNNGNFEQAESLAREVLSVAPQHGDGLYLLGLIAFQSGAWEPSERLLYEAVRLYPQTAAYQLALASVLERRGRYDEALRLYAAFEDNPQAVAQAGFVYLSKRQDSFARSAFERALQLDKKCADAYLGMARAAQNAGDDATAESFLKQGAAVRETADIWYALGCLHWRRHALSQAAEVLARALKLARTDAILNMLGVVAEEADDLPLALDYYTQALALNPYLTQALTNQGNIWQKQGQFAAAEEAYKRALRQDGAVLEAHHNLAGLLQKQGRTLEALEHYRAVIEQEPEHLSAQYNLAVILESLGEYAEAAGLYFNAMVRQGAFPDLDFRVSVCLTELAQQGKAGKKQALTFALGWVKNYPKNPVALHTQAVLKGRQPSSMKAYACRLYEAFAETYEETMAKLEVSALDRLVERLPQNNLGDVLDLACGTGIFATKLNHRFNTITGVDISPKMLARAAAKEVYTHLVEQDILAFLKTEKKQFDVIAAMEVSCYLPALETLLTAAGRRLKPNGLFALSIETTRQPAPHLAFSGRYLYPQAWVRRKLESAGLRLADVSVFPMRKEKNGTAEGALFICQKACDSRIQRSKASCARRA